MSYQKRIIVKYNGVDCAITWQNKEDTELTPLYSNEDIGAGAGVRVTIDTKEADLLPKQVWVYVGGRIGWVKQDDNV